jgi:hypothetical protein
MSEPFEEQAGLITEEIAFGEGKNGKGAEGSLFDQLRARREEIALNKTTTIPIPGFEDFGLEAQYRLMERQEITDIGDRVVKETRDRSERIMMLMTDTMIFALDGFVAREKGKPDPTPVHDPSGNPVLTWSQMVQELGGDPADDRAAVYWIFADNELAIGQHSLVLNRWMGNTSIDIDGELGNPV